jgi:hypothetical protein
MAKRWVFFVVRTETLKLVWENESIKSCMSKLISVCVGYDHNFISESIKYIRSSVTLFYYSSPVSVSKQMA